MSTLVIRSEQTLAHMKFRPWSRKFSTGSFDSALFEMGFFLSRLSTPLFDWLQLFTAVSDQLGYQDRL